MTRLLSIQSSPNLQGSASRSASRAFIDRYAATHPGAVIDELDLVANPPSHIGGNHLGAFFAPPERHSPESADALKASESFLEQLFAADIVVVGTPMHNLSIASVLKSWIDNVCRVGRTFKYDDAGQLVGLLSDRMRVVLVVGCGGIYSSGAMKPLDYAAPYLTAIFGLMGVTEISVIHAEATALGPARAADGIAAANAAAEAAAVSDLLSVATAVA